jgi:hypothetical protein
MDGFLVALIKATIGLSTITEASYVNLTAGVS